MRASALNPSIRLPTLMVDSFLGHHYRVLGFVRLLVDEIAFYVSINPIIVRLVYHFSMTSIVRVFLLVCLLPNSTFMLLLVAISEMLSNFLTRALLL